MKKHEYICNICEVVKNKSTCGRSPVGTVLVNEDYEIISTGYNGPVRGQPNCEEEGHLMREGHCVRTVHSEVNAVAQCARAGKSCRNSIAYVTYVPCEPCAKLLIQAGIKKIYAKQIRYVEGLNLLRKCNVEVYNWEEKIFDENIQRT